MTEEEYWDLLDAFNQESEWGNQIIIYSGGNLDDPPTFITPTYINKKEA